MPMSFPNGGPPNISSPPTGSDMDLVASHQRALIAAIIRTTGPILELGVGWYSTPLLHELATGLQRRLWTFDNNEHWLKQFKSLENKWHKLELVGWWKEIIEPLSRGFPPGHSDKRFGVCFVDQGQPIEREYAIRALKDRVDIFVMHDTEEGRAYGYDRLLGYHRYGEEIPKDFNGDRNGPPGGLFKYQWTDKSQQTWTTLASDTIDPCTWDLKEIPQAAPCMEVT